MGSFNTKCFASNQTIAEGDACRIIAIVQQSSYNPVAISRGDETLALPGVCNTTCYADSFWRPLGSFIAARYTDCGEFELLLEPLMRAHVLNFIGDMRQEGWNTAQGENRSHDHACDLPAFMVEQAPQLHALLTGKGQASGRDGELDAELVLCWNYLWGIAAEHRLFRTHNHYGPRPLQFAVLHEHAYQVLVERAAASRDWDGNSNEPEAYLRRALAQARAEVQKVIAEDGPIEPAFEGMMMGSTLRDAFSRAAGQSSSMAAAASRLLSQLVASLVKGERTEDNFIERCLPMLRDQFVIGSLNALNLRFSPYVYAPGDGCNAVGQAYLAFATKVCERVTRDGVERLYGDFRRYQGIALTAQEASALPAAMKGYDGAVADVVSQQVDGRWHLTFSCTLSLSELQQTLAAQDLVGLAASVAPLAPAAAI
jgi:hypothetical protein